jgi:hypothetical protein
MKLFGNEILHLESRDVIAALIMTILGVIAFQIGYYRIHNYANRKNLPVAELFLDKSKAVLYCVIMGLVVPALLTFRGVIPEEFAAPLSSILALLQNQVLVVIGVLGWLVYGRKEGRWYAIWLYGLVILTMIRGVSSGSLETAVVPLGVLFAVKWLYTRKLPTATVVAAALVIIFLSPVKADYRREVWFTDDPAVANQSTLSKAALWGERAKDYWLDTFSGGRNINEATATVSSRADLIHQVAYIHSLTPSDVPFQWGATYSYFAVALIPRIIWPDKPVTGTANNFFAVSYGLSSEEGTKTTTFGMSLLGEAFINFNWPGVALIMFLQGAVISMLQHVFGGLKSGPGGRALFLAFFIFFLNGIGSSAEILFGNIFQNLLAGYLLLLWARQRSPARRASLGRPLEIHQRLSS